MLPPLGWSSLHDQTHTVLVTAVTAATWWVAVRLVQSPRPARYALLGLVLALGLLSKYNFALVAAALGLAALSVPATRRVLLARGLWITVVVMGLLVAPHALWQFDHWHETASAITDKMELQSQGGLLDGLGELALTLLETLLLWALLAAWAFRGAWLRRPPAGAVAPTPVAPWAPPLLARYLALVLAAFVAMVVLGGVTEFKEHWMQPVFCVLPLAAFAWRPQLESAPGGGRFTGAVLGVGRAKNFVEGVSSHEPGFVVGKEGSDFAEVFVVRGEALKSIGSIDFDPGSVIVQITRLDPKFDA